ncbi:MAG: ATP-binding cassette domain-containing protein [Thermomicrobiales bacterium]
MMASGERADAVIVTRGLSKQYGIVTALDRLSLTVPTGTIYGFLGPNGAGKTTTIKLLMGFVRPTAGSATIFGHDTWRYGVAARRDVGYLVDAEALYPDMTGEAQLNHAATLSGRSPALRSTLLDALELSRDALGRKLGTYSRGMRQKLALIAAIQHDPPLLILDEPTEGLDPLIQRAFEEVLRSLRDRGRTIFMSSHDLAEVERTCERVAVVRAGKLVVEETIEGLMRLERRRAEITFTESVPDGIDAVTGATLVARNGRRVQLSLDGDVNPLLRFLANHAVAEVVLTRPNLEDIFMGFYGGEHDEVAR